MYTYIRVSNKNKNHVSSFDNSENVQDTHTTFVQIQTEQHIYFAHCLNIYIINYIRLDKTLSFETFPTSGNSATV